VQSAALQIVYAQVERWPLVVRQSITVECQQAMQSQLVVAPAAGAIVVIRMDQEACG
jgi:hypothetical protein